MNIASLLTFVIVSQTCLVSSSSESARASVSLRFYLKDMSGPACDETVYKVMICVESRMQSCSPQEVEKHYVQDQCVVDRSASDPLTFEVDDVDSVIQLNVQVEKTGTHKVLELRPVEMMLRHKTEVTASTEDMNLRVVFQSNYSCLPNFYGESCSNFCDNKAKQHTCDSEGNSICRQGYYKAPDGKCYVEKCKLMPNYCQNDGVCSNNPTDSIPLCRCPLGFHGDRCEKEVVVTPVTGMSSNKKLEGKPLRLSNDAAHSNRKGDKNDAKQKGLTKRSDSEERVKVRGDSDSAVTSSATIRDQKHLLWTIVGICILLVVAIFVLVIFIVHRQGSRRVKLMQASMVSSQPMSPGGGSTTNQPMFDFQGHHDQSIYSPYLNSSYLQPTSIDEAALRRSMMLVDPLTTGSPYSNVPYQSLSYSQPASSGLVLRHSSLLSPGGRLSLAHQPYHHSSLIDPLTSSDLHPVSTFTTGGTLARRSTGSHSLLAATNPYASPPPLVLPSSSLAPVLPRPLDVDTGVVENGSTQPPQSNLMPAQDFDASDGNEVYVPHHLIGVCSEDDYPELQMQTKC